MQPILLTGFEPYGGYALNPSQLLVEHFNGTTIAGQPVVGQVFPVTLDGQAERVRAALDAINPSAVINLGLAPGSATLRLERTAVNLADFDIEDNSGALCRETTLATQGPYALAATAPMSDLLIELLAAGIPAQLSNSAGTYLCNALSYQFLSCVCQADVPVRCGFFHLPLLPEQTASLIQNDRQRQFIDHSHPLASMSIDTQQRGVEIILRRLAGEI